MPNYSTVGEFLNSRGYHLTARELKTLEQVAEFQFADEHPHDIDGTEIDLGDMVQIPDSDEVVGLVVALSPNMVGYIDVNTGNHVLYKSSRLRVIPLTDEEEDNASSADEPDFPEMPMVVVMRMSDILNM